MRLLLILIILLIIPQGHIYATDMVMCMETTLQERFDAADIVLTGKVIKIVKDKKSPAKEKILKGDIEMSYTEVDNGGIGQTHYLKVGKTYKGKSKRQAIIYSSQIYLNKDEEYLIFANFKNGRFEVFGSCSNDTIPLSNATNELIELEKYSAQTAPVKK